MFEEENAPWELWSKAPNKDPEVLCSSMLDTTVINNFHDRRLFHNLKPDRTLGGDGTSLRYSRPTILVTGSRKWNDFDLLENSIRYWISYWRGTSFYNQLGTGMKVKVLPPIIVHGGCPEGADLMVATLCEEIGLDVQSFSAEWKKYGKQAGLVRNIEMLRISEPDIVLGFSLNQSPGTRHCVTNAIDFGIQTQVIYKDTQYFDKMF